MFVDKVKIIVKGGDGGNGCASFRREKFVPLGGPSGGDGGNGGNVIITARMNEHSLVDLLYKRHHRAVKGENGRGKDQYGKTGADINLYVPIGTVIKDIDDNNAVIADLGEDGKSFIAVRGGMGGRGNIHFKTSTNRAPRECEPGTEGELRNLELELKTIADIGLVGYPNAGKSTLLSAVSAAKPKIAAYPFTTLHPIVGTIEFDDYSRMLIADIPGLIDGAHNNIGLGHSFLRHIERTRILVFVIDMAGIDGRNPLDDYYSLKNELEMYMKGLSGRPSLIVANKMDLPESIDNYKDFKEKVYDSQIVAISAGQKENLDLLLETLKIKLKKIK
ncbi:MAG TPA: GTPase ObgE [Victivallales bacterium]|nr:GTPase ObgE [Victivallales bacterium]